MRKPIIGAVAAAVALGGAAVAFGDDSTKSIGEPETAVAIAGGPRTIFGGGPDGTFAADLAAELDGVTVGEVEQALRTVADKQLSEHRRAMAEAISAQLDGVSVEQVESALAAAEERMRESFESGEPPAPDVFIKTLADELGVSEEEVADALATAREEAFNAHREEAEQKLDDAVEAGRLSEKEADAIRDRLKSGPPMFEFGPDGAHLGPGAPPPPGAGLSLAVPAG